MPIKSIPKPANCTKVSQEVVKKLLKQAEIGEPSVVVTMASNGLSQPYQDFTNKVKQKKLQYKIIGLEIIQESHKTELLKLIDQTKEPLIVSIMLGTCQDEREFLEKLNEIRLKRENNFVTYIFSNIIEIYSAWKVKMKIIDRSLNILPLRSIEDQVRIYQHYEELYDWKFHNQAEKDLMFQHSCGHVGLTKTLFILARERGKYNYQYDELLQNESVQSRLYEVWNDLPKEKQDEILKYDIAKSTDLLWTKFDFVLNGEIIFPLFFDFIHRIINTNNSNELNIDINLRQLLTPVEISLFSLFKEKQGEVILREDIASVLWGEQAFENYSDWAIDQVIHRLRTKLKKAKSVYKIITKKGQGFILK